VVALGGGAVSDERGEPVTTFQPAPSKTGPPPVALHQRISTRRNCSVLNYAHFSQAPLNPAATTRQPSRLHRAQTYSPSLHFPLQGYLAHKKQPPPETCSCICLGPYGGPGGRAVSDERGTHVDSAFSVARKKVAIIRVQGYLAHKTTRTSLRPP
jgi:hypothetical protein